MHRSISHRQQELWCLERHLMFPKGNYLCLERHLLFPEGKYLSRKTLVVSPSKTYYVSRRKFNVPQRDFLTLQEGYGEPNDSHKATDGIEWHKLFHHPGREERKKTWKNPYEQTLRRFFEICALL